MKVTITRFCLLTLTLLLLTIGCNQQAQPTISAETPIPSTSTPEPEPEPTDTLPAVISTATTPATDATATPVEPTAGAAEPTATTESTIIVAEGDGALVSLTLQGNVGVLLDGLSAETQEQMVDDLLNASSEEWEARALRQLRLARLRLNFRNFYADGKGQLPLPPQALWTFEMDAAGPSRQTVDGHDLVMHAYTFRSTLLTDEASLATSEPALAEIGGQWDEPFIFPADPDHLLQRTDNACLNEAGFPPNSYDAINAWHFYDYTCTADSNGADGGCHRLSLPALSCRQAVSGRIGEVAATMQFERLAWDDELADSVRMGDLTSTEGPDLVTLQEDMNNNRIIYRYFSFSDCAYEEGATGGAGWRRLLLFDATVHNTSPIPLHIGKANAIDDVNNVFIYAPCHAHFHYSNYGDFTIAEEPDLTGGKQAFCVQSTNRASNNETSPLIHDYTCSFQGIQAGWVDEYIAGLDAQWVDITDLDLPDDGGEITLGFASNRDQFICEGTLVTDENGEQLWEPSGLLTEDGEMINRPQCDFIEDWDVNNESTLSLFIPETGSYVTQPCTENTVGPLRNCDFTPVALDAETTSCTAGDEVTVALDGVEIEGELVVRACERSELLGAIACEQSQSILNRVVASSAESITLTCPLIRDSEVGDGGFSLYVAPLYEGVDSAD